MTTRKRDTSLGTGVYFAPDDYIGIMRRVMIMTVDLAVLIGVYLLFALVFTSCAVAERCLRRKVQMIVRILRAMFNRFGIEV